MSNESIIYLVAACSGVFGLAAYVGLIVVPAWTAYSRIWERLAATLLTLYVLAGFLILGVVGGAAVIWFWDRIVTARRMPAGSARAGALCRIRGAPASTDGIGTRLQHGLRLRIGACPPRPTDRRPGSISLRWTRSPTPSSRAPACPRSSAPPLGRSTPASC